MALASRLSVKAPSTLAASAELERDVSDVAFVNQYRVPFQFRDFVAQHLRVGTFATASDGSKLRDLDGNWSFDLGGAYGVNVLGADFVQGGASIDGVDARARRWARCSAHVSPDAWPTTSRRLKAAVGHWTRCRSTCPGTEAVMQAVRLARYHTRSLATPCASPARTTAGGTDVQAGPGNPSPGARARTRCAS
jgi:glutamate-1-semialdehyde 2,1-aminomutase